jgi:hypothetical protein
MVARISTRQRAAAASMEDIGVVNYYFCFTKPPTQLEHIAIWTTCPGSIIQKRRNGYKPDKSGQQLVKECDTV